MKLLERYKAGHTVEVYQEIGELEEKAFEPVYLSDVTAVLTETFNRVNYNLEIIYDVLLSKGYNFRTDFNYPSEKPLTKPLKNREQLLSELSKMTRSFGHIPLSLSYFYKVVGSCNFTWNYATNETSLWNYADPIEIIGLDDLISLMLETDWEEEMTERIEEDKNRVPYLVFSADYYHKDNVSGGQEYALELTKKPSIDSKVLFDDREHTFISYLRRYFDNCGFMKITYPEHKNDYRSFFDQVKPKLVAI